MFKNDPLKYTEIAHDYPCCNLPIKENCDKCSKKEACHADHVGIE